jgi:hypothetical protein
MSAELPLGTMRQKIRRDHSAVTTAATPDRTLDAQAPALESAVLDAALGPGIAPWIAARLGLGWHSETQLSYTGRRLRLGARRAIELQDHLWASAGLGGSSLHAEPAQGETHLRAEAMSGWGVDLPVVVGWQSRGQVVAVWGGLVAGFDRLGGHLAPGAEELTLERAYGGGLFGFSVGVEPVRARAELAANYSDGRARTQLQQGRETDAKIRLTGFSIAPAVALAVEF